MAGGIQTANGKAFEYACVLGLFNALRETDEEKWANRLCTYAKKISE